MSQPASAFTFTADERALLGTLRQTHPQPMADLEATVHQLLDQLVETMQGLVISQAQADATFHHLHDRLSARTRPHDREPTQQDELHGAVLDLIVRDMLASAQAEFVRRVVETKTN